MRNRFTPRIHWYESPWANTIMLALATAAFLWVAACAKREPIISQDLATVKHSPSISSSNF